MTHSTRWTVEKITQRLALITPLAHRRHAPLAPFRYLELADAEAPPPVAPDLPDDAWPAIPPNTHWGRPAVNFVLRGAFTVPAEWAPDLPVALYLPLGDAANFSHPEALVYVDGQPFAASDRHHQEVLLPPAWADGRPHALALHGWTGLGADWNTDPVTPLVMRACAVVQIDPPTREFIAAARVALGAAKALAPEAPARSGVLNALHAAFVALDTREPFGAAFYASVPVALATLRAGLARAGAPLEVGLTATGHAHIDVAWLWTLAQTRQKAARTFHTVLRLMEQFPEYHFTQSQPQLYDYVRRDHPALFEAIRARVAEGRWEATGGMWVEADCNLSGAEALARQFVLGRAFFREHFGAGAETPVLWLPDVFGYAWALPQLIKQAGLEYFFTIKIGWNQYNRLPYDSFWWQGLDGTRVLTHFSTAPEHGSAYASTYNAPATPDSALGAWKSFQQKEAQTEVFMAFGYGDGGGGPTREMLENLREMAAFPGLPRARQRSAGEFFRELEQQSGPALPVWNGELYLEYHRGTYTTQARNKAANRRSEFLLHDAEFLAALAAGRDPAYRYPQAALRQAWELVCLNQFHDIIPGSSIGPVYADSQQQYAEVRALGEAVRAEALAVLHRQMGGDLLLVNPTGFAREDLAFWPGALPPGRRLAGAFTQSVAGGTLIGGVALAPYSAQGLAWEAGPPTAPDPARLPLTASPGGLENAYLRVALNAAGDVTRVYDKAAAREVLPAGAVANQFQAFEDRPLFWDAWDIDIFYDDKVFLAEPADSITVIESGPLRATLEIRRRLLHSAFVQRLSLAYNSPQLEVETVIDWRERHILLKAAFPVEVLAPTATHEIQWGSVQRPTHRNTSWDWARFETCAHKWVDLSEGGYGVALLNDSKYGHDLRDNVIRLSLLRSPTIPDPEADQGEHRFVYRLFPHANPEGGGVRPAQVAAAAYALNDPVLVHAAPGGGPAGVLPALVTGPENVIVETVKQAEDGDGLVLRLYECHRQRGWVTLRINAPFQTAWRTNLLEAEPQPVAATADGVRLYLRPFEIVTLRLRG